MSGTLKDLCHTILPGNKKDTPAEHFTKMAQWCQDNNVSHDIYGEGEALQAFEQKVATLLGYESGLFVITGTMTQPTVLDIVARQKRNPNVAMHPSSHIYLHEKQNYQLQNRFNVLPVGNPHRPWTVKDLQAWPDEISAVLYELPIREIGGQLPSWQELEEIKTHCKQNNIHLHIDGARLFECGACYQRSYAEIAEGFDTAYVSLYKGINGMGGAMLLGSKSFIELASTWMKRQGGNVYHRTPYLVSAAMQFDAQLEKLPALFKRTQEIYQILEEFPSLVPNPVKPQANMFHLILPCSHEKALEMQRELAEQQGIWMGNPQPTSHPNQSNMEWYVGDNLLELSDEKLREIFTVFSQSANR